MEDRPFATIITNFYGSNPWAVWAHFVAITVDNVIRVKWPTFASRPFWASMTLAVIAVPAFNIGHFRLIRGAQDQEPKT